MSTTPPPTQPSRIPGIILICVFILVFIGGGVINLYNTVRYRMPPTTTLKETPAFALPTYVTLKDITFDVAHMLKLKFGTEILFVPVRARGASSQSEYPVVIQMSAADLLAAVASNSSEMTKRLADLATRTEVTGRVCSIDSRRLDSIRKEVPLVSRNVVLIDDGATPSPIFGSILLSIGLGAGAIVLAGGLKPAKPAPAPEGH